MYAVWKYLHLLLFVFWVGTDVGVLLLARKFRDASLPVEARVVLLQQALVIDTLPRVCFVAMLPAGFSLAAAAGLVSLSGAALAGLWLLAAAWLALGLAAAKNMDKPIGPRLQRLHWAVLGVVGLAAIGLGAAWAAQGLPQAAPWLGLKLIAYGAICFAALGIDRAFLPIGPATQRLVTEGSSPALEREITATVNRSLRFVYAVYAGVLLAALVGVARPVLG